MKKKTKAERPYSVDGLMRNIASNLARDFQDQGIDPSKSEQYQSLVRAGAVREIRTFDWRSDMRDGVHRFKCAYQLESLFKRYRFEHDICTSRELEALSIKQFLDNQERLRGIDVNMAPRYLENILFVARGVCQEILGSYDVDEHVAASRFGRRASVGIPLRNAVEAERYQVPITGSKYHIDWFRKIYLPRDCQAKDYIARQVGGDFNAAFQEIDTLALTLVPKTFKSLRSIMPNTTIGTFYSGGLGVVLQRRLQRAGYDIRTLQKEHAELARLGSITGKLVTADQSLASDNITVDLVKRILPWRWFEVLNRGRIGRVILPDGQFVDSQTFCTMGIGFTFPLQTLIFLSLLKAISIVYAADRCKVSVYGDDLIYDKRIHPFVLTAFQSLGLKINVDKTFSEGDFRESCGSDYYRGVDVRPFQPRNESGSRVRRKAYEVILYKYINGLRRRWLDEEVTGTLRYLLSELAAISRGILRVPHDFPDEAGVKVRSLSEFDWVHLHFVDVKGTKHGAYRFFYLRREPAYKEETRHAPYLWRKLGQHGVDESSTYHRPDGYRDGVSGIAQRIERITGAKLGDNVTFRDVESSSQPDAYRSRLTGRRLKRVTPMVADPGGQGRIIRQTGVTSYWTP